MGSAMWTGGQIAKRLPDVDWDVDPNAAVRNMDVNDRAKQVVGKSADALRDTPLATQRRVGDLIDDLNDETSAWLTRRIDVDDSDRMADAIGYLRRTGSDGRDLLNRVGDSARTRLVALNEAMQGHVASAADSLRTERVESFLEWYEGRSSAVKSRIDGIVQDTGPSGVGFFGRADADTRKIVMADGGEIADDVVRVLMTSIKPMSKPSLATCLTPVLRYLGN